MPRQRTPSFILELLLRTSRADERACAIMLDAARNMTDAIFEQFCPSVVQPWKELRRIERAMDRSKWANNPECFDDKGRWKKGVRMRVRSKRYQALTLKRRERERHLAAERKRSHGELANRILGQGTTVKTEKLSYKAWQRQRYGRRDARLGSSSDDIVQEAFIRWMKADRSDVREPEAFLHRTVTRLCLDQLKSARRQRETYVGLWLRDPVVEEDEIEHVTLPAMLLLGRLSARAGYLFVA